MFALAGEQIELFEDLHNPGSATLETGSLGIGGYVVTTEVLGGSTLEGLIVGGATFVAVQGGSKLL